MKNILLFVIFALIAGIVGCRTSKKKVDKEGFLDGEEIPLKLKTESGNPEESVPSFLWSPSRRKSTAGYYYLVAEYMVLNGDINKSLPILEVAYNLDPNPFLGAKLIAAKAYLGNLDEALPEAKKMVLLYPRSAELHYLYAVILTRRGLYEESVVEFEKAIDIDPKKEEFYFELAKVHQENKQPTKAIAVLKDFVSKVPTSAVAWVSLAKLYIMTSQKKESLDAARKAYDLQSNVPENVLVLALALDLNGKPKEAISLYEQIYRLDSTNEEVISRMVDLYRSLGDLNESLELLNELSKLPGGDKPGVQLQRAFILWEMKKFEDAAEILNKLSKDYPEHDRLQYLAALGQEKLKEYDRALETYSSIPESSQFAPLAKFRMAYIFKEQRKFEDALKKIEALISLPDHMWETYILGGAIYDELEKFPEAVRLADIGYKKFLNKPHLLFMKGVYQEKAGEREACIETMREVIKADPTNSSAYNYLGYLYAERGENLDEARQLIEHALTLKPGDGYYLDSLGWVYYQKKDYERALQLLNQGLEKAPNEGVIIEHIGDVYVAKGNEKAGIEYFEKALRSQLEKKDKTRIEQKLDKLKSQMGSKKD